MITLLLVLEFIFLIFGIILPLAEITEFWFFSNQFSVLSLSFRLLTEGEILLGVIVIMFGAILPLFKLIIKFFDLQAFHKLGLYKAGMIDVFLFSFLVYASKVSEYFTLTLKPGFYCLLIAVLLSILREMMAYYIRKYEEVDNQNEM